MPATRAQRDRILFALATILFCSFRSGTSSAAGCNTHSVGIDTSLANSLASMTLNEALGQTFVATDTLIASITIWRDPEEVNWGFGVRIYILPTDSTGAPANEILGRGPAVFNPAPGADGIHPIELKFVFDPPYALPKHGTYEMAFLAEPCSGDVAILARYLASDAYAAGVAWSHARSPNPPCEPRFAPHPAPDADLIFTIEFCDTTTPVRAPTWGQVKIRYR